MRARCCSPILIFPVALTGCLAQAALDVATAPVKVASAGVDAVTRSQSEADQQRGQEIREREENLGRLQRDYDRLAASCRIGNDQACREAVEVQREIDVVLPTIPREPSPN